MEFGVAAVHLVVDVVVAQLVVDEVADPLLAGLTDPAVVLEEPVETVARSVD